MRHIPISILIELDQFFVDMSLYSTYATEGNTAYESANTHNDNFLKMQIFFHHFFDNRGNINFSLVYFHFCNSFLNQSVYSFLPEA